MDLTDKLGGRKFILTVLAIICLFILVVTGNTDVDKFLLFLSINLGIYTAGNVGEKVADGM